MGLFDDAIFGSENHLGTFGTKARECAAWDEAWYKADELIFEEELCQTAPNGGEAICGEQYLSQETSASTVETLRKMHISYLNKEYDKKLLGIWTEWKWDGADAWQGSSLYDYIESHLGYRFLVKDVKMSLPTSANEQNATLILEIENVGFANFYEEAEVILELEGDSGKVDGKILDTDIRKWNSGQVTEVCVKIPLQSSKLYLMIRRKKDGRSITFANLGTERARVLLGIMSYEG